MLTADLAAITGIRCVWEPSDAVGVGVAPEASRSFNNWASLVCDCGWMPLSGIDLVEKVHPAINIERHGIKVDPIDEDGWSCVDALGGGVLPHLSDPPLRIMNISVPII